MSGVITNKEGKLSSVEGYDAVDVYRIRTLIVAIKMIHETNGRIIPTRGFNMKRGLEMATTYTGNKYKRTEAGRAMLELQKIMDIRLNHVEIVEE